MSDLMTAPGRQETEDVPLSFAQERIWYLDRVVNGNTAHHVSLALRLRGSLDEEALSWTVNELVRRHEALRSAIRVADGEPRQFILPFEYRQLARESLDTSGSETVDDAIRRRLETEARKPFDLGSGNCTRWLLLRVTDDDHVLIQTTHHAFMDGASRSVIVQEMEVLYAARLAGTEPLLPSPTPTWSDHVRNERGQVDEERMEKLLDYWREQLGTHRDALELPLDHARPPLQRFRGRQVVGGLDAQLTAALTGLAQNEGATPFMAVLAAFEALLFRYTGRTDLVVGTVTGGRTRSDGERLVGCLINTVAVCTDLSGDPSFRDALARAALSFIGALKHQDAPFERVVEAVRPERTTSRMPLIQVLCRSENDGVRTPRLPGLDADILDVDDGGAYCDLDLSVLEHDGTLRLTLTYDRDLFDHATVERMMEHLKVLVRGAVADPERRLSELPLLTDEEWKLMVEEWNDTSAPCLCTGTMHALLEAQAYRNPRRTAVEDEAGEKLAYEDLHVRADAVADALRKKGAGPGRIVAVAADRSVDTVVALLGVLKSGAAYMPIDTDYPKDRLSYMLEDSRTMLVLTTGRAGRGLPGGLDVPVLALEDVKAQPCGERIQGPEAGPDDTAYVIYTSGSTGKPKGVKVPHRAGENFLRTMAHEPGMDSDERLLAVTTTAFDIAVLELFLPLSVGATVVIASKRGAADPRKLLELIETRSITMMQATPATWRMLLDAGWKGGEPGLRVLCGGEAMPADLCDSLLERSPEVWNLYGPTEATVWCTRHRVEVAEDPVPIGRPLANTRAYVLDAHMNPLPIGAEGELWIGGACLALGYHDREELTAERFVPDPFSDEPRAKLYRTGDLARWRPDGRLAYKGRRDHQVKVRGFRIELGEVEAALSALPEIRETVAAVTTDPLGERRLVAWAVFHRGQSLTGSEVRRRLRESLPDYLIPSMIVELDAIPLTPNGKADRRALPDPLEGLGGCTEGFEPPTTALEKELARIWGEVLSVDRVGAGDNFFDLGGHSLLCMRTVHRMEAATGFPFDPRTMVLQTLRQIAAGAEAPS